MQNITIVERALCAEHIFEMIPTRIETSGDEHFSFIKYIEAVRTLFGGTYRIHDRNATVILHLGNEFVPLFSTRRQVLDNDECVLICVQKGDDLPGLICFVGSEVRSDQGFLNMAIMILWFCRQESSQCIIAVERSPWAIATGDTPSPRFIRDFTTVLPAIGCSFVAIFPRRDGSARSKSRLVSYIASSQTDFQLHFVEFTSFCAYNIWLRERARDLRAYDMSKLCLFTCKEDAVANLCLRFEALENEFPEDAAYIARKLGNPNLRRPRSKCLNPEPEEPPQFAALLDHDDERTVSEDWDFDTNRGANPFVYREETVHGDMAVVIGTPCAPQAAYGLGARIRKRRSFLPTIDEECDGASPSGKCMNCNSNPEVAELREPAETCKSFF